MTKIAHFRDFIRKGGTEKSNRMTVVERNYKGIAFFVLSYIERIMRYHHTDNQHVHKFTGKQNVVPLWRFQDIMGEKRRADEELDRAVREIRRKENELMVAWREKERMENEIIDMKRRLEDLGELEELREWKRRRMQEDREQEERVLAEAERRLERQRNLETYGTENPSDDLKAFVAAKEFTRMSWVKWRERNNITLDSLKKRN